MPEKAEESPLLVRLPGYCGSIERFGSGKAIPTPLSRIPLISRTLYTGYAGNMMKKIHRLKFTYLSVICRLDIWRNDHGQDLIEYALMAGFVAVAAGTIMPGVSSSVSRIFSKVASVMSNAAS